jgi:hypothetical protein
MISSRNLHKYQKIVGNTFAMSANVDEFFSGLRSAATHLFGSVGANFLFENKCSSRDIRIAHEYEYGGVKVWWYTTYCNNYFTIHDPFKAPSFPRDWQTERNFLDAMKKDPDIKKKLIPKMVYFFAKIHNKEELWTFNAAECILLGIEPCLQKVEQPNSK